MSDPEAYERRKALRDTHCICSEEAYFKARSTLLDTNSNRRVFQAGFSRGWEARCATPSNSVFVPPQSEVLTAQVKSLSTYLARLIVDVRLLSCGIFSNKQSSEILERALHAQDYLKDNDLPHLSPSQGLPTEAKDAFMSTSSKG